MENAVERLSHAELVRLVEDIINPGIRGLTSEEVDECVIRFCMNCPDPAGAMDLIVDLGGPETAEGIVSAALSLAVRDPRSLPNSELQPSHPLRHFEWPWRE